MNPPLRIAVPLLLASALAAQAAAPSFGHARTRELAELDLLPTPLEVAVADLVNFHRHRLPLPRAGESVALDVRFGSAALQPGGEAVLQFGFTTAPSGDRADLPPLTLALVIDCSGSMGAAGKLDEVRRGLAAFADRLRRDDRVAIGTYSDAAAVAAPLRAFGDGGWFRAAVAELRSGGSTNLHGGLMLGLREVANAAPARGSSRVILLTDGIANRGETAPDAILRDAQQYTDEGVDLATIGLGRDLNTALLDRLARGGRGLFHFVADSKDIAKVFVDEAEGLMAPALRRPVLRFELPPDLELEHCFGHLPRSTGGAWEIELPDFNRGMTAVVVCRCRLRRGAASESLAVRAELSGRDAASGERVVRTQEATARVAAAAGDPLADAEVQKNFVIATLAQGLHDMAECAQEQRWADADRVLRRALELAREQLPNAEDADVRAVLQMAEDHARTLRRYVDRFRDYE